MRAGDVLNGYTILEDFKVVGAGLSKWTFAERGGRQFFIKEFLSPTYPDDDAPGSEKIKAKKRARCAAFEAHHRGVQRALAPLSAYGGNLIVTLDFFRWGAKYYKVTEKVDAEAGAVPTCGAGLAHPAGADEDRGAQPEDPARPQDRAQRPEAEQRLDQAHRAGLHHEVDRLRQRLHRRPAAAAGGDRRHDQLLLPELLGYIQEAGVTPGRARRGLRRLRPGTDLYRVPDRSAAALRRGALSRAGGG